MPNQAVPNMPSSLLRGGLRLGLTLASLLGLSLVALGSATLTGGNTYAGQCFNYALGGLALGGWWLWRGVVCRARWPLTGLEGALAIGAGWALLACAASPDPRLSAAGGAELAVLVALFYFALDSLRAGLDRRLFVHSLLFVTGIALLLGLVEVYFHYAPLWQQTHSLTQTFAGPLYRVVSLVGNVNFLAGMANLALPLALWAWQATPSRWSRSLILFWGLCYGLMQPFLASRAGLLALVLMVVVLGGGWLWQRGNATLQGAVNLWRKQWPAWVAGMVLIVGAAAGWLIYLYASGRGDLIASRTSIWQEALTLIARHPLLGVGPRRYGFEVAQLISLPPVFWPIHAHNVLLTVAAEYGMPGALIVIWLAGGVLRAGWRGWQAAQRPGRLYLFLVGTALAGFAFHNLFDDLLHNPAVAVLAVLVLALFLADCPARASRQPLAWSGLALALLAGVYGYRLWGYAPLEAARSSLAAGDQAGALADLREAIRRDPPFAFYKAEAGLVAADLATASGTPADWQAAAGYLASASASAKNLAFLHADLGLARRWAGDPAGSLAEMETAARLAPQAETLNLTAGWLAEKQNRPDEAQAFYLAALRAHPAWQARPFWQQAPALRAESLAAAQREAVYMPNPADAVVRAEAALAAHDLEALRPMLQQAPLTLPQWLANVIAGDLALADGREADGMALYRRALARLARPSETGVEGSLLASYAGGLYARRALDTGPIPGLLTLEATPAVLERFAQLAAWAAQHEAPPVVAQIARERSWVDPDGAQP